jgi:predicted methyltransferase
MSSTDTNNHYEIVIIGAGFSVIVESGAGVAASYPDADYQAAGATIAKTAKDAIAKADIVFKVRGPEPDEIKALKPGGVLAVEQHRSEEGLNPDVTAVTGYMPESYIIRAAEAAGFVLDARSELNANPKDDHDHPFGVWTLPPVRTSVNSLSHSPGSTEVTRIPEPTTSQRRLQEKCFTNAFEAP